jgi:exopolyphosphatase/guanosine-5'-triphosphate,3'-diphosphate pyrophosphatase
MSENAFDSSLSSREDDNPLCCAAIDLGTNTCRLLIAQTSLMGGEFSFKRIDSLSRTVRFGESIEAHGALSRDAIDRALYVLEECARRLSFYKVDASRCVATAACRYAKNAQDFVTEINEKTGINIEVISPEEESRLAVAGCAEMFSPDFPYALILDIGGGSTELVWVKVHSRISFEILDCISFPYGFSTLRQDLREAEARQAITQFLSSETNEFALRNQIDEAIAQGSVQMIGSSGTITTLAAIILNLPSYDRLAVHNAPLSRQDILNVMQQLTQMSYSERVQHPCIGHHRAESIVGGITLFQAIYDILSVNPIVAADRGVREGILFLLTQELLAAGK